MIRLEANCYSQHVGYKRNSNDIKCNVVWRVYDAEKVEAVLQKIIAEKQHPREFSYEIEYDEEWKLVEWYMQDFHKKK